MLVKHDVKKSHMFCVQIYRISIISVAPKFVRKPSNTVSYEKEDVELECKVYGQPEPSVHWLKNGELIIESQYFQVCTAKWNCCLNIWMYSFRA